MSKWVITQQNTSVYPIEWGTISSPMQPISANSRWYGARDDEEDWSAWIDNNPPVVKKPTCSDGHDWVDTGLAKTWCKRCDLSGRWVLGHVEIEHTK